MRRFAGIAAVLFLLLLPLAACGEPQSVISRVDLPAPLAPIRVTISPFFTSTLTSCSAWILP